MKNTQIQDLIDIEDSSLTINNIDSMIRDHNRFDLLKLKYGDEFYSTILRTITHENYNESIAKKLFEEILVHLEKQHIQIHIDLFVFRLQKDSI